MRWFPYLACHFSLAAFILSLVTVVIQLPGNKNNPLVVATFNTSHLGLAEYHDRNSHLNQNISDLVPFDAINSPSITKYLGLKDWYSWSYLSICSGYYTSSKANSHLLSTSKTNITCSRQRLGYTFSLRNTLQENIKPSVYGVINELPEGVQQEQYKTRASVSLWVVGVIAAFTNIILLPFAWSGTNRVNMYTTLIAFISFAVFDISASLVTRQATAIQRDSHGSCSTVFQSHIWIATSLMLVSCLLAAIEWNLEWWTPKGERITIYWKPKHISWWNWKPAKPRKINWDARRGL